MAATRSTRLQQKTAGAGNIAQVDEMGGRLGDAVVRHHDDAAAWSRWVPSDVRVACWFSWDNLFFFFYLGLGPCTAAKEKHQE